MTPPFRPPPLRWRVTAPADAGAAGELARSLGIPAALAALLVQRGYGTSEAARSFLRPSLDDLSDPLGLAGMADAVDVVVRHVRAGDRILVHGDYDVDGQCASALLTRVLRVAGAEVWPFLPHRLRDGYDFGPAGLAEARNQGAALVITCDCGITAMDAVAEAHSAGLEVIVTDHHLPGPALPPAAAVVDPQRADDTSGLTYLCGTGIAFKLAQALVPALGLPTHLALHLLDLVALATVADVVPLVGENRVLVRHGLRLLGESRWPGVRALVRVSGLEGKALRAGQLGFILGPRLNAAGRLGDARDGLRLLLSDDPMEAERVAHELEGLNAKRQAMDQRILEEAIERVEQEADPTRDAGLVLASDDWHPGVVGIVASRVVERYGRPTFLVAFDGEIGKGSGRSISSFHLHRALVECSDLLDRFGGHQMAAGITIRRDNLEAFKARFAEVARRELVPDELGPEQRVDLILGLPEATEDLERLCRHLEPSGMGNPAPVFGVRNARFTGARRVGQGHLRGAIEGDGARLEAIGFQWADRVPWLTTADAPGVDVAFRLEQNEWQGEANLQARILALAPTEPGGIPAGTGLLSGTAPARP